MSQLTRGYAMLDESVSYYFNALLADVEWQDGITPGERETNLVWGQSLILDAARAERDLATAYTDARETLRYYANRRRGTVATATGTPNDSLATATIDALAPQPGDTFVVHRGAQTIVVGKI